MTTNPMAKKARNSFLLGVVITLVVATIIVALVGFLLSKKGILNLGTNKKGKQTVAWAYRLKQDVKFGEEITPAMVEAIEISSEYAPTDFFPSKRQESKNSKKLVSVSFGTVKAKTDLKTGTILGNSQTYIEEIDKDIRVTDYNMLTLPTNLQLGDKIDIRLSLPNGADFIVISQKMVKNIIGNTLTLNLSEDEILLMNNAIVETYLMKGANLYVIKYVDPILQTETVNTYVPNAAVQALINEDSNIVKTAKSELATRLSSSGETVREIIKNGLSTSDETQLETKVKEQIENAKKAREAYLNGLTTY